MIIIVPQPTSPRKDPLRLRRATAQTVANLLVFLAHGVPGNLLPGGPDFSRLGFFALEVFRDDFADLVLEVKRAFGSMTVSILRRGADKGFWGRWLTFLPPRVQFAVDEDAGVEVGLGAVAERFVFFHDAGVGVGDGVEVFVGRVAVAVHFVVDFGLFGRRGLEFLDHHEVRPVGSWVVRIGDVFRVRCGTRTVDLRYGHRDVGEVVGGVDVVALRLLFFRRGLVVFHVAFLEFHVVAVDREERRDVGVCGLAVVAFIEVVRSDLPVVVGVKLVRVVQLVVIEVELVKSRLLVGTVEGLLPGDLGGLLRVQVNPDEPLGIDTEVDREQAVLGFVEILQEVIVGRLGQLAVQAVRPSVIAAREDVGTTCVLLDDGVCAVAADVVKCVDRFGAVHDDDEVVTSHAVAKEVTWPLKTGSVREENPLTREDSSTFELIHLVRRVPCCGQRSYGRLLVRVGRRFGLGASTAKESEHCM